MSGDDGSMALHTNVLGLRAQGGVGPMFNRTRTGPPKGDPKFRDWTGHQYKKPEDLTIDYQHRGRCSSVTEAPDVPVPGRRTRK